MSHASAQVLFPDGTVLHAEYNGTADIVYPGCLYETFDEMWENWRLGEHQPCTCGGTEKAIYWTSYGGGWTFEVEACQHCQTVLGGDPNDEIEEGIPAWVVGEDN